MIESAETEEDILRPKKPYPRCITCKRYMKGHEREKGSSCKMKSLTIEELEKEDERVMKMRIEEFRARKGREDSFIAIDQPLSET